MREDLVFGTFYSRISRVSVQTQSGVPTGLIWASRIGSNVVANPEVVPRLRKVSCLASQSDLQTTFLHFITINYPIKTFPVSRLIVGRPRLCARQPCV